MRRMAFLFSMPLAIGIVLGMMGYQLLNASQASVKVTQLFKTDLTGSNGHCR